MAAVLHTHANTHTLTVCAVTVLPAVVSRSLWLIGSPLSPCRGGSLDRIVQRSVCPSADCDRRSWLIPGLPAMQLHLWAKATVILQLRVHRKQLIVRKQTEYVWIIRDSNLCNIHCYVIDNVQPFPKCVRVPLAVHKLPLVVHRGIPPN